MSATLIHDSDGDVYVLTFTNEVPARILEPVRGVFIEVMADGSVARVEVTAVAHRQSTRVRPSRRWPQEVTGATLEPQNEPRVLWGQGDPSEPAYGPTGPCSEDCCCAS